MSFVSSDDFVRIVRQTLVHVVLITLTRMDAYNQTLYSDVPVRMAVRVLVTMAVAALAEAYLPTDATTLVVSATLGLVILLVLRLGASATAKSTAD